MYVCACVLSGPLPQTSIPIGDHDEPEGLYDAHLAEQRPRTTDHRTANHEGDTSEQGKASPASSSIHNPLHPDGDEHCSDEADDTTGHKPTALARSGSQSTQLYAGPRISTKPKRAHSLPGAWDGAGVSQTRREADTAPSGRAGIALAITAAQDAAREIAERQASLALTMGQRVRVVAARLGYEVKRFALKRSMHDFEVKLVADSQAAEAAIARSALHRPDAHSTHTLSHAAASSASTQPPPLSRPPTSGRKTAFGVASAPPSSATTAREGPTGGSDHPSAVRYSSALRRPTQSALAQNGLMTSPGGVELEMGELPIKPRSGT